MVLESLEGHYRNYIKRLWFRTNFVAIECLRVNTSSVRPNIFGPLSVRI
jgi:hypothetical protein